MKLIRKLRTAFDHLVGQILFRCGSKSSAWMDLLRRMMYIVDMDADLCTITEPAQDGFMNIGPLMISLPGIAEGTL